jgi:hypothetical protein
LPLGLEWAVEELGGIHGVPVDLLLSLFICAGIVFLYRFLVSLQGVWLQAREQRILQIVTTREE